MKALHFLFAWRYFKAKKSTNAINVISWISIVAIVVGTASLILVLSVFNGFEDLVKSLYSSFYPDLRITPASGKQITLTQEQLDRIRSVKGIKSMSLVVEERALLQKRFREYSTNGSDEADTVEYQSIVYLKGVDANYGKVTDVPGHVTRGTFELGNADEPRLVLGYGVENALHTDAEQETAPISVYLPRKGDIDIANPMQSLSTGAAYTSGTFVIQQEFDNKYAITNLDFLKQMLNMEPDAYGAAEIATLPDADIEEAQAALKKLLGKAYVVQTRYEQNVGLYSVMQIEKWIIYAILCLILVVAAFNMIGALTMLVLDKKQDISVLHAMGADSSFIKRIFLSEGLLLALLGGGIGMLLAFIIGFLQLKYHLIPLQGSTFMIGHFPVKMIPSDFLLVGATVLVIAFIAAWLPAQRAARQQFLLRSE
jgi:lipoprotein-releasing system permease protein